MDVDYQKYLDSLHKKNTVPDEVIDDLIYKVTGQKIQSKVKIIAGEVNEVYRIQLVNNLRYVLRIAHKDSNEFVIESWAMDQARGIGVPVPTIIAIDNLETQMGLYSYCLMEELIGESMERGLLDFHTLGIDQQKNLLFKSGEVLSKIHSIKTVGWGPFVAANESEYNRSEDVIVEYLDKRLKYSKLAGEIGVELLVEKMLSLFEKNIELFTKGIGCLNHGDFGPKHIMVSGDLIIGIIDWGLVRSDLPFSDIANWDYWFEDYPVKWLLEGYQNRTFFDDYFETRIHLLRMIKGIDVIEWYWDQKYVKGVSDAVVKLKRDVEFFR